MRTSSSARPLQTESRPPRQRAAPGKPVPRERILETAEPFLATRTFDGTHKDVARDPLEFVDGFVCWL